MKLVLNKQEAFFKRSLVNKIIPLPVTEEHSAQRSGGCWHTPVPAWGVIWAGFWRCRGAGAPKQAPVAPVSLWLVFSAPLGPPQLGSGCQPCSTSLLVLPGGREPSGCCEDANGNVGPAAGSHISVPPGCNRQCCEQASSISCQPGLSIPLSHFYPW